LVGSVKSLTSDVKSEQAPTLSKGEGNAGRSSRKYQTRRIILTPNPSPKERGMHREHKNLITAFEMMGR